MLTTNKTNFFTGLVRVERSHVAKRGRRYIADFFNTMLDIKWRYVLLIFTMSFFASWLGFAALWYAIAFLRGDLVGNLFGRHIWKLEPFFIGVFLQEKISYICVCGKI